MENLQNVQDAVGKAQAQADPITDAVLLNWFTHHAPDMEQQRQYLTIRETALGMAQCIRDMCPPSADRTHALRQLRSCVMTANQSIACGGK